MEDKSRNHSVPERIRYFSMAVGLVSIGFAARTLYAVVWSLSSLDLVLMYGFGSYSIAVTVMQAVSALGWLINAFLMYRVFKRWRKGEADRYFSVIVLAGVMVGVANLVQWIISPHWLSLVGGWQGMNIAAGIGCVAGYYVLCKGEGVRLDGVPSFSKILRDLKWAIRGGR